MDLQELHAIAKQEMARYGLHDWSFVLKKKKRQLGVCVFRAKRIEINEYYATHSPPETVLDTLRHEIAHALAGFEAGHSLAWKAMALKVGAVPRACSGSEIVVTEPGTWQAICPTCGRIYPRHQCPIGGTTYTCRCPARSPLTFEFMGDPARKPQVPKTFEESAKWRAHCMVCGHIYYRLRRPSAGIWYCKCPGEFQLTWWRLNR